MIKKTQFSSPTKTVFHENIFLSQLVKTCLGQIITLIMLEKYVLTSRRGCNFVFKVIRSGDLSQEQTASLF